MERLDAEKYKNNSAFLELQSLLEHLQERNLPPTSIQVVEEKIEKLARTAGSKPLREKEITGVKNGILKYLQKEHGLVPEKYYTTLWMSLGMSSFGLPIGVLIYVITNNPAFIAIGLPIGLGAGTMYGGTLDKKAEAEGKVLKFIQNV